MWAYTFSGDDPWYRGPWLARLARGDGVAVTAGAAGWDPAEQPQANPATVATASSGAAGRAIGPGPAGRARRLPTACTLAKTGTPLATQATWQTGALLRLGPQARPIGPAAGPRRGGGLFCTGLSSGGGFPSLPPAAPPRAGWGGGARPRP